MGALPLSNYQTAASSNSMSRLHKPKKSLPVRNQDTRYFHTLDNKGMVGQSISKLLKLDDALTVVPLRGEK